jgi:hypothetical protein
MAARAGTGTFAPRNRSGDRDLAGSSPGTCIGYGGCNSGNVLRGPIVIPVDIPAGLAPGTYTVAFMLTDAGNLTSQFGYPNSAPVPGGPLEFTVTGS